MRIRALPLLGTVALFAILPAARLLAHEGDPKLRDRQKM
jgi:hypothetical protein